MKDFAVNERGQRAVAEAGRKRLLTTAFAQLALAVCLIVSIVVILAVAGTSGAMAANRNDLIMMEETAASGSTLTTMGILAVIAVVMGILTILALRDVAPAQSKRDRRHIRR